RVLKPHLLATYEAHLDQANQVYEPPTRRILARCAADEKRHIAAGRVVLSHLVETRALEERVGAWQDRLEGRLAAWGGASGRALPRRVADDAAPPAESLSDDARELIRLGESGSNWAVPEDLDSAIRMCGDALIARDWAGLRRALL